MQWGLVRKRVFVIGVDSGVKGKVGRLPTKPEKRNNVPSLTDGPGGQLI